MGCYRVLVLIGLITCSLAPAQEIWRMEALEKIGGARTTIVGAPKLVEEGGAKALQFDGAHDGVFVENIPITGASAFTIEVLFYPAEGGPAAQRFFHVQDTKGVRGLLETRTDGKGSWWLDAFLANQSPRNGTTLIDPKRTHPTNRWYWVAMRFDGKTVADFVNGVKELEAESHFPLFGPGKVSIGVRQNLVYWFKGAIREVRFHREALADEKLQRVDSAREPSPRAE